MTNNQEVPKKYLRYFNKDFGVRFDIPYSSRNIRIKVKTPLPPINAFPDFENKYRTVIDFAFEDISPKQKESSPGIFLTIYLTRADLVFANNDLDRIVIYDWKPTSDNGQWVSKADKIVERGSISPPLWKKYIGYVKLEITSWDDPPIAVGT